VFLPDAMAVGARKIAVCDEAGFEGVFPLDPALVLDGLSKADQAALIFGQCVALMRSCDAVIANLTPFRGVSADAGTVFEVGYMAALGRPVLGYSNTALDFRARSNLYRTRAGLPFDADHAQIAVEDFDLADNLMIAEAIRASGSRLHVVEAAAEERMTNLAAFRLCLADAAARFVSSA
jgi:nucleoside 2-deoxyribosyltransferase